MKSARKAFDYMEAFSRNIGWVTEWEQLELRGKRVAIAGMGGVGGVHMLTLARLGIGAFHVADMDDFDLANFNRQIGATMDTVGLAKVDVLETMAHAINPEAKIVKFAQGIDERNIDAFLAGVDLFVDGFDFFVLDIRAKVFARCAELGIPAVTAAPIGVGTAYLVFMPGGMTFEDYFGLQGLSTEQQYVNFLMGLVPKALHRSYLMDPTRLDLAGKKGPSSVMACQLCAGAMGAEALKILLGRGRVRAAPYYHQFDAYRGRWAVARRWRRNPLERLKLKLAYKGFARLSENSWQAPVRSDGPEVLQILDLARWAPSGDNTQPWRFTLLDDDTVLVRIGDQSGHNVYEYKDGEPILLAAGMLLETIQIAASKFGRLVEWTYEGCEGAGHRIRVAFRKGTSVLPDPLLPYVTLRSVDRDPYRKEPLSPAHQEALAASLGSALEIRWHGSAQDRRRWARLSGAATDIRLRIPEAHGVHTAVIDWDRDRSPTGIPARATGLGPLTLKMRRWAMRDWRRVDRLNGLPGGTLAARLQMDYLPGRGCAAYFSISAKQQPSGSERVPFLLHQGQALQRFWLTATRLGLVLQPATAILIFGYYGRHGTPFTESPRILGRAKDLARQLDVLSVGNVDDLVFMGRIGRPVSRRIKPRSVRRPLEQLLTPAGAEDVPAEDGQRAVG